MLAPRDVKVRRRAIAIEPDGTFRIDDAPSGIYELLIIVNKRPVTQGLGNETLATTRREVVVPAIPGGRSDLPLDVGAITFMARKNEK